MAGACKLGKPKLASKRFRKCAAISYTSQTGIGLQEILGDELRALPGGDAYKNSSKLFLIPYDDRRILVSARTRIADPL